MADTKSPSATAKPTVGNQRTVTTATSTFHRAGNRQHFAHARPTFRAFITNHEHGARFNVARHDCSHCSVFAVENSGRSFEMHLIGRQARNFDNCTVRCKRAAQNIYSAFSVNCIRQRMNNFTIRSRWIQLCQILGHGLTRNRQNIAVQQTCIKQVLHYNWHTTNAINISHVVFAAGFCVGNMWHFCCDAIEIIKRQCNTSFVGDGQQVQHGVSAATQRVDDCNCIFKSFFGHDVTRVDAKTQKIYNCGSGALCIIIASRIDGWRRSTTGQTHAQCLGDARHCVGREHATACSFAWASFAFNFTEFVFAHLACRTRTDCFKHRCDVDVFAVMNTWQCRAVVNKNTWQIKSCRRHQHRRNALVAAG